MMIKKNTNHFSCKLHDVLLYYKKQKVILSLQSFKQSMVFLLSIRLNWNITNPPS